MGFAVYACDHILHEEISKNLSNQFEADDYFTLLNETQGKFKINDIGKALKTEKINMLKLVRQK